MESMAATTTLVTRMVVKRATVSMSMLPRAGAAAATGTASGAARIAPHSACRRRHYASSASSSSSSSPSPSPSAPLTAADFQSFHPSASSSPSSSAKASSSPTSSIAASLSATANSQTKQAELTLRRFWKDVSLVQEDGSQGWSVLLDKRVLKTPSGKKLLLPQAKRAAAVVIAHEWDSQSTMLKPHSLPMTSIASRAIDGLADPAVREQVVQVLNRYLHTDTVCFVETGKSASLTQLQDKHWVPLIKWARERFGADITVLEGQLFNRQSQATVDTLSRVVEGYDEWKLAGFERAVMASKSYIIGLGLMEGHLSVEDAALAAHVEVQSNIDRWGEVEDTHDVDHQDVRVRLGSAALIGATLPGQK